MECTGSPTPQGQGQGPSAMAERQQQQQGAAADTHTPAQSHGGAPGRAFFSLAAAQDHIRQQDGIITEQARSLESLSTSVDTMSIQLAQLLSLVRHRDMPPVGEAETGQQGGTPRSAVQILFSFHHLLSFHR